MKFQEALECTILVQSNFPSKTYSPMPNKHYISNSIDVDFELSWKKFFEAQLIRILLDK